MNKDELVGYIQGLIDMSKETDEILELKLLRLISEALEKHKNYINNEDVSYFNKKADAYSTPLSTEASVSFKDDVDKGWIKHNQITKRK